MKMSDQDKKINKVEQFLNLHNIGFIIHFHKPVFTCEEASKYCQNIPGQHCKNLFLLDKETNRFFLVILPEDKRLDFSNFAKEVNAKKIVFASNKLLEEKLDLEPGSVSLFGIINDKKGDVFIYIDKQVYEADIVSFHPNVNTATLELSQKMFHKFLKVINNKIKTIDF